MVTDGLNPLNLLTLLGGIVATGACAVAIVIAWYRKRRDVAKRLAAWGAGAWGAYVALLLIASFASHERVLSPGEEKHICEVDCHLAYSVAGVETTTHDGMARYVVTVRVRFDSFTIASWRPRNATLSPNSRYMALVDTAGRRYPGSTEGLRRRLIPGEAYTTDLVFEVPASAQGLRLILRNDDFETQFVIGHENSWFHGRTTFGLGG